VERKIKDSIIYNPIEPDLLYFNAETFRKNLEKNLTIQFNQFDSSEKNKRVLDLEIKPVPDFALAGKTNQQDPLNLVKEFTENKKFVIACLSESFKERISKILPDYNIKCPMIVLPLHFGFYTSDMMMIGEQAIFGEKIVRKKTSKAASRRLIEEG
jgi:transcription-repair coupling factor (superfamily II helicase)